MKRIGIFVVYDQDGIIDASEEYLLNSLEEILDRLVVVINGKIEDHAQQIITHYTDEIIRRPNIGFDGGAYQDVFLHYLKREELQEYDELLLINDTFYGPFYSWNNLFKKMEIQETDFWGLTKHPEFYSKSLKMHVAEHIQSYFMVLKNQVFMSEAFSLFWKDMKPITSHEDAIKNFEILFTRYLSDAGFRYMVYTDLFPQQDYLQNDEPVFSSCCYFLLRDYHFPILKKKNGVSVFNSQLYPSLNYIKEHYEYDEKIIWENAVRTIKNAKLFDTIRKFREGHEHIYIYGCGKVSQAIGDFFMENKWDIEGYLETNPQNSEKDGKPIIAWKDFQQKEGTGIIVALGKVNTAEVMKFLPRSESVLFLSDV